MNKVVFTPSGGAAATLADLSTGSHVVLEELGGAGIEQVEPLMDGSNVVRFPRGNVAGDCVFTVEKSFADKATAAAAAKTEYARMMQQGLLVLTIYATTLSMANAVLRSVKCSRVNGVRWGFRYTFGITTIT